MAEILSHPTIGEYSKKETFSFEDGGSITLEVGPNNRLSYKEAIYMLEDVKFRIMTMMYRE
jgi:hypothetical protein